MEKQKKKLSEERNNENWARVKKIINYTSRHFHFDLFRRLRKYLFAGRTDLVVRLFADDAIKVECRLRAFEAHLENGFGAERRHWIAPLRAAD